MCRGVPSAPYSFLPYSLPPQPCFRPILPSAPYSLPPQPRFSPSLPSAPGSLPPQPPFRPSLPCVHARVCWVSANFHRQKPSAASLPPHTPVRPIFPTAPASLQPQPPVRPRLPSALGSLPPQPLVRPRLPSAPACPACMRACVGCQRIFTGRSQVWRRGACQLAYIDARCMRSFASAPRLIGCRVAGWHVVALVHASANSERPTAGARANSLSS